MRTLSIRTVTAADVAACVALEAACFEPSEAASEASIRLRQRHFPEGFFVAERHGGIVGFINSVASDRPDLADEELKKLVGHRPDGKHLVILSVAVAPELQGQGYSRPLMEAYLRWAEEGATVGRRESVLLLCKKDLIPYYRRFGFEDRGPSASEHGGAAWHEMHLGLRGGAFG